MHAPQGAWLAGPESLFSDRLLGRRSLPNLSQESAAARTGRTYELRFTARRCTWSGVQQIPETDWVGCPVRNS
jgi:hypothetical protein